MPSKQYSEPLCSFCGEVGSKKEIRKAATFGLDKKSYGMCSAVGRQAYFCKTIEMQVI